MHHLRDAVRLSALRPRVTEGDDKNDPRVEAGLRPSVLAQDQRHRERPNHDASSEGL
jgi:hypothetical protein